MAEKSAGKGYKSPINLGLGQMPKTDNSDIFPEMVEVYNAIHLLNAYLDNLRDQFDIGKKGSPPDEQLPFKHGLWGRARTDIKAGEVVTYDGAADDIHLGVILTMKRTAVPPYGFALTDAKEGEQVQMGIGPAIIKVGDIKRHEALWAGDPESGYAGKLIRGSMPKYDGAMIGMGIGGGYAFIYEDRPLWED